MELLLLDTTEKEGEDNKLYHYVHHPKLQHVPALKKPKPKSSSWLDLRGVLAAAVGTTTSVCGEPLQCARFRHTASAAEETGVAGFVNLYEVLYVLIFPVCKAPMPIVQVGDTISEKWFRLPRIRHD